MMFFEDELVRGLDLPDSLDGTGSRGTAPLRIAFYSHDAQGLGHLRRNLLISRSLSAMEPAPSILLLSGLRETATFGLPDGVDCVTLPSLGKDSAGQYETRSLGIETDDLISLRSDLILSAIRSYRPDVLIVDKLPLGVLGELAPSLAWLRKNTRARLVVGMRDILDEPGVVRREWARDNTIEVIREYYDRVWVYGDRDVYAVEDEYSIPADIAAKIRYTGYLNPRDEGLSASCSRPQQSPSLSEIMDVPGGSLTLCSIGGGRDGLPLAMSFLESDLPAGSGGVLVTGPLMDGEDRALLNSMVAGRSDMRLIEFVTDPEPLLCCADRVICMGGYNSVCEVLALQKRALIVPRVTPRREQIIRAERFAGLGLLDMLHPDELDGGSISAWMNAGDAPVRPAETALDFDGLGRLPSLLDEVRASRREASDFPGIVVRNGKGARHV